MGLKTTKDSSVYFVLYNFYYIWLIDFHNTTVAINFLQEMTVIFPRNLEQAIATSFGPNNGPIGYYKYEVK